MIAEIAPYVVGKYSYTHDWCQVKEILGKPEKKIALEFISLVLARETTQYLMKIHCYKTRCPQQNARIISHKKNNFDQRTCPFLSFG